MNNGFDPVDQEIAEVRQKLIDRGAESFTVMDWQFLLAHKTLEGIRAIGGSMDELASAIRSHIQDPIPNGIRTKRQLALQIAIPGLTGAGIIGLLTQLVFLFRGP